MSDRVHQVLATWLPQRTIWKRGCGHDRRRRVSGRVHQVLATWLPQRTIWKRGCGHDRRRRVSGRGPCVIVPHENDGRRRDRDVFRESAHHSSGRHVSDGHHASGGVRVDPPGGHATTRCRQPYATE